MRKQHNDCQVQENRSGRKRRTLRRIDLLQVNRNREGEERDKSKVKVMLMLMMVGLGHLEKERWKKN